MCFITLVCAIWTSDTRSNVFDFASVTQIRLPRLFDHLGKLIYQNDPHVQ